MIALAFLSDIHSNLEALDAVLSDIDDEVGDRVESRLYCLGDIVGCGASPNEVIGLLRDNGVVCISGNHDQAAVTADVSAFNPAAAEAALWTFRNLDPGCAEFLKMLPLDLSFHIGGRRVYLVHGSPDDQLWEYVTMDSHASLFPTYLRQVRADLIGIGHTHVPFVWRGPEGMVFNPGSVGQPRDGDRRAGYATLTIDDEGEFELAQKRVDYDVTTAARRIREAGLPGGLAERLFIGR